MQTYTFTLDKRGLDPGVCCQEISKNLSLITTINTKGGNVIHPVKPTI